MPLPVQKHFWRRAKLTFRWFRIAVLLLVLAVLCALVWLNRVGLPDFLKQRLLAELRAQGVEVEFSRMRLRYHGIVAENVRIEQARQSAGPRASAAELAFRFDHDALWRRQLKLRGVALSDGRLVLPLAASNASLREIVVERLQTQVDFHGGDRWQLSAFEGHCFGTDFRLTGSLAHAPALLAIKVPSDAAAAQRRAEFWNTLVAELQKIVFTPAATLKGTFSGDAQMLETSSFHIELAAPHFNSPWATGRELSLALDVQPGPNALARVNAQASARSAQTPWGHAASLQATVRADLPLAAPQPQNLHVTLNGTTVQTPWGRAGTLRLGAEAASVPALSVAGPSRLDLAATSVRTAWAAADDLTFQGTLAANPSNSALLNGAYELRSQRLRSRWLDATNVLLTASTRQSTTNLWPEFLATQVELQQAAVKSTNAPSGLLGQARMARFDTAFRCPPLAVLTDTNASWLQRLTNIHARVRTELKDLQADRYKAQALTLDADWQPPSLGIESLQANLYGGQVSASARLDMITRELTAQFRSEVNPHRITPLFTVQAAEWAAVLDWEKPPQLQAAWRVTLPAWTNRAPDWRGEVLPTLSLAAAVQTGAGVARTVPFHSTRAAVVLTNLLWEVRDLEVVRPEGRLALNLDSDERTRSFHARLTSEIDPTALALIFASEDISNVLGYFQFTQPPRLEAEAWGCWTNLAAIGLQARLALTNAVFREQTVRSCVTERITYTNQVVDVFHARVERPEGVATVDRVQVDIVRDLIALTNVIGHIDPLAFARAVGPHMVKRLSPYRFSQPPTVHFEGRAGLTSGSGLDDARFEVSGGPFQWQNFKFTHLTNNLHWLGDTLTLSNFDGTIHEGTVRGGAAFDFSPQVQGTIFRFDVTATNIDAKPLLTDLFPGASNRLAGRLGGHLTISNATTADDKSWFGSGDVSLSEGMIWDEPVFALFSPMVNKVVPGLGNSRARHAAANFLITNSVITSRDLDIHATGMRMQFVGAIDFEGRVQGSMEAELLRDTPGFGWLVSKVLWPVTKLFEFKITGTLAHPKMQPTYIPKPLLAPLHPLRTIKELFGGDKDKTPSPGSSPEP